MGRQGELFNKAMDGREKGWSDPLGDRLARLFELQKGLTDLLASKSKGPLGDRKSVNDFSYPFDQSQVWTKEWYRALKEMTLGLMMECSEMMDWLPWKHWKLGEDLNVAEVRKEVAIETIDILHFLINMWVMLGLNWDDVVALYEVKNAENRRRAEGGY